MDLNIPERPRAFPLTKHGRFKTGGFRWMKKLGAWRYAGIYFYPDDEEFPYLEWWGAQLNRKRPQVTA